MRILLLSDVYFPRINGVSTSIQTFAHEFLKKGHEVTLLAPGYDNSTSEAFNVIRIPSRKIPFDPEDRLLISRKVNNLYQRLADDKYDLLHVHTPFAAHYAGLNLSARLNIPVIESYHTYFEEYLDKYIPLVPRRLLRYAARRFSTTQCNAVDALIVPSHAMLDVLKDYGVTNRAEVIPTGLAPGQFDKADGVAFRRQYKIHTERPVLVHVGRIAHEKNIGFLIQVLAEVKKSVPDVLLVIAGEGPAKQQLQTTVEQMNLSSNTLFAGYLSRNGQLQNCYAAGNAFIFASNTETQGLVLLEAMASGTPVISTAAMGTKEVLASNQGAIISEARVSTFAKHTVCLLRDKALQQRLSLEGMSYAQQWSAPVMAQRMLDLYDDVNKAKTNLRLTA